MRALMFTALFALALGPAGSAFAQNDVDFDVQGTITGMLDGELRKWQTFTADVDGESMASANWQRNADMMADLAGSFGAMTELVPPEQRAQLEALMGMSVEGSPMAEMMAQMAGMGSMDKGVTLTISGFDPDSPNRLQERFLVLEVYLSNPDSLVPGAVHAGEVNYFSESSGGFMPDVLYVSGYDDNEADVKFDRLEMSADGGGHAVGRFRASLCRVDMKKLMDGPDLSDCMEINAEFDTKLVQDKSS